MRPKMLINPYDYQLFLDGRKYATSRYGDRREEFSVGKEFDFECNDGSGLSVPIVITGYNYQKLSQIRSAQAKAIGDYDVAAALIDFTAVYSKLGRDVTPDTMITIVYFGKAKA